MITVKIVCACGQKYAFDVEPINGRMLGPVQCPVCGADGTAAANEILTRTSASQVAPATSQMHRPPPAPPIPSRGIPPNALPSSGKSQNVLLWVCVAVVFVIGLGAAGFFLVSPRSSVADAKPVTASRLEQQKPDAKVEPKVDAVSKDDGQEFSLELISSGAAMASTGTNSPRGKYFQWYRPQNFGLQTNKPASFKVMPKGLHSIRYGTLSLGPTNAPTRIGVVQDTAKDGSQRLFVDANANGDFSDDPDVEWKPVMVRARDPKTGAEINRPAHYGGSAVVRVAYGNETLNLGLHFYCFVGDARRSSSIMFYRDYARTGKVKFGNKEHEIVLSDDLCRGSFIPKAGEKYGSVSLYVDTDDDGTFDISFEGYQLGKPFNIGGTTYELNVLDDTGGKVRLTRSAEVVAERKFLGRGEKALPFTATTIEGATVHFPTDYKGKLVMLQFLTLQTNSARAFTNAFNCYKKYRSNGLSMVGVFTDLQAKDDAMRKFASDNELDCALVYDGGYGESKIMKDYTGSSSLVFLVDGDNGTILGNNRRGGELGGYLATNLTTEIETALATKKK